MRRIIVFFISILFSVSGLTTTILALSDSKSDAIQKLLDDACYISGVPGMSL